MRDSEHERLAFEMSLILMKKLGCEMYLTAGVGLMVCLEHPDAPEHELQAEGICPFARHQVDAVLKIHEDGRLPAYIEALDEYTGLLKDVGPEGP
ncbi:hypothetical protein BHE97_18730 [Aeromicrobium sp. PE09-221]|uniref:hypothetical protein n=1 Tax=Aeromicrobium sp. PE09-221 TaxID=1898043 RepID=UPI000B3E4A29|nr:hypothetical protein [Aeromicrobium sp. PE09-221]OUZ06651.1 hypothetical protein BHE97_18730 [Aeromicrobium sp. PE09-221]